RMRPVGAAVGCLVNAPIAAGRPQRALRRDVDDVRVARIDRDLPDVLRIRQTDALPGGSRIRRLIEAVADHGPPRIRVLSAAEPQHIRVARIDDDAAQIEGASAVEDWLPGIATVFALP